MTTEEILFVVESALNEIHYKDVAGAIVELQRVMQMPIEEGVSSKVKKMVASAIADVNKYSTLDVQYNIVESLLNSLKKLLNRSSS